MALSIKVNPTNRDGSKTIPVQNNDWQDLQLAVDGKPLDKVQSAEIEVEPKEELDAE